MNMDALVPAKAIAEGSGSGAIAPGGRARNGKIAPVEIIESEFPTRVEHFELLRGTGGCIINPDADDERSMPSRFGD